MKNTLQTLKTPFVPVLLILSLVLTACSAAPQPQAQPATSVSQPDVALVQTGTEMKPTVTFTLTTGLGDRGLAFIGSEGHIDGISNPRLNVDVGDVVQIIVVNGDGAEHDIVIPDYQLDSGTEKVKGELLTVTFVADRPGEFAYYCSVPGHRQAGMEGLLVVKGEQAASGSTSGQSPYTLPAAPTQPALGSVSASATSIVLDPSDLPGPLGDREPQHLTLDLEAIELDGLLADGTTYNYWTFNGTVPGPFLRIRVGDTVDVNFTNRDDSFMYHSVDFHAVTGPGGGAAVTQAAPGETLSFTFKALNPGLYVYHCATPMVAHHITNGMYGLILVEPEGGLPPVDREFYVMQGELYTSHNFGTQGHQGFDVQALLDERPQYFVFNGAVGALTAEAPLKANVGETVRIYFGVGGPNFTSSFHVIGEIFDRVYDQGSLTAAPLTDVQTTLVPPGGAAMVEFALEVPGRFILVDHALSRAERGLAGFLIVDGPENPEIFHSDSPIGEGH
jgi:nitrite reductase (NO-forming)